MYHLQPELFTCHSALPQTERGAWGQPLHAWFLRRCKSVCMWRSHLSHFSQRRNSSGALNIKRSDLWSITEQCWTVTLSGTQGPCVVRYIFIFFTQTSCGCICTVSEIFHMDIWADSKQTDSDSFDTSVFLSLISFAVKLALHFIYFSGLFPFVFVF